ncbi:hypothetical protein P5V30_20025 [Mycobacteroides abscessus subsp. abscessus]|nr:hypothetical protein [Mycobacteroides abscessus]MDO2986819.1 hypothetical protein [Mycobacteroides abscessus subsp. abscessus]SID36593.1 Uncharacterised protein [Mycobacteroides abscessus subsp. abscessus]SIJ97514.1 Uncharacterised protein [Mycobacteroides abscessus subsp. abscessus]
MSERPLVEVRIGWDLRYVSAEMADKLLLLLCQHDEMGVCNEFWGPVAL